MSRGYIVVSDGIRFPYVPSVEPAEDSGLTTLAAAGAGGMIQLAGGPFCIWRDDVKTLFYVYLASNGDVCARSYALSAAEKASGVLDGTGTDSGATVLHAAFEVDLHAAPSMAFDSDDKIIVIYSKHGGANLWMRKSTAALDVSAFDAAVDLDADIAASEYTYPSIWLLDSGRHLIFYRATDKATSGHTNAKWAVTYSDDDGDSWSAEQRFWTVSGRGAYVYPTGNGSRADILCLDGNPGTDANVAVYHIYTPDGETFYDSEGTALSGLPLGTSDGTLIDQPTGTHFDFGGQIRLGSDGNPRVLFANSDGQAKWGKWDGSDWTLFTAGTIATISTRPIGFDLDTVAPNRFYAIKTVSAKQEVWRFTTPDDGTTWIEEAITVGSSANHWRVHCPLDHGPEVCMIAMQGTITSDTSWNAATVAASGAASDGTAQRVVVIDGDDESDGFAEAIIRRQPDGTWQISRDAGNTWEGLGGGDSTKWIVDPGTATYTGSGPVTVALTSKFGIDSDGNPYFNSANVTDGEEAALGWDSETETYFLRPYYPA